MYDYVIVGAGLYGAVFAHEMTKAGKRVLVLDKRDHIAGNVYTEPVEGIQVHRYGAHIFHTNDRAVWEYVNRFVPFHRFTNAPIANFHGELYNLPFNMNTFYQMWGVTTPEQARAKIAEQVAAAGITTPKNLEEQAISMVGTDIYEKLIQGYTAKQWGRACTELPSFIIQRLPVRFVYDNNYFNDAFQGIPQGGYTPMIEKMLEPSDVVLSTDFFDDRAGWTSKAKNIVFTGMIDHYFDYCFGALAYRSLRFETETVDTDNAQGVAVMNYTDAQTPYTRIIEHKHFEHGCHTDVSCPKTVLTKEFPAPWQRGDEPYYPMNDTENNALYARYAALAEQEPHTLFGGRLGRYRYMDMDKTIGMALEDARARL